MNKTFKWILLIFGLLFLIASSYFVEVYISAQLAGTSPQYFAPTDSQEIAFKLVSVVAVMFLGIVSGYLFEKAKSAQDGKLELRAELSKMISSSKFVTALVVSPIIFNSIYLVIGDNPKSIGDYLLAFQNGFFWQSMVDGLFKSRE